MAKVEVTLPNFTAPYTRGEKKVTLEASTLEQLLQQLASRYGEEFRSRILDDSGKPKRIINIYVNGRNYKFTGGVQTILNEDDKVSMLAAVAGGSGDFTEDQLERYSRQIMLEDIGYEGQRAIRRASVGVIGVGGLGNHIAMQLASMGIGKLRLVDRDIVDLSNLHRQPLYDSTTLGMAKVEAAQDRLRLINPDVEVEPVTMAVEEWTAHQQVNGLDIVLDGLDSIQARYAINRACCDLGIPYVYGSALELTGAASTILPGKTACLRCIYPELEDDELPKCGTVGVHPSIISIIANIEVVEAIRILTGRAPALAGSLLYCDLTDLSFERLRVGRYEKCQDCGEERRPLNEPKHVTTELCGRERGKRVYALTPTADLDLDLTTVARRVYPSQIISKHRLSIALQIDGDTKVTLLKSGCAIVTTRQEEKYAREVYERLLQHEPRVALTPRSE